MSARVHSQRLASRGDIDLKRRARLRAWLHYYKRRRGWTNERLADEIGIKEPTLTNILNGVTTAGFDVFIKMHDNLRRSADDLLDTDPPNLPDQDD